MRITVVIPDSGDRPEFLKQAVFQMETQTMKPDDVFIITSEKGVTGNVRLGYETVKSGLVFIIENDDLYRKDYIETMVSLAEREKGAHIFGSAETIYYHVGLRKYRFIKHPGRSSLFHTAIMAGHSINWPDDNENFLDLALWNNRSGALLPTPFAVGIKHGIGKCGGIAHRRAYWEKGHSAIRDDSDMIYLSRFTDDMKFYREMSEKSLKVV